MVYGNSCRGGRNGGASRGLAAEAPIRQDIDLSRQNLIAQGWPAPCYLSWRRCFQGVACGRSYVRCSGKRASAERATKACPVAIPERQLRQRFLRLAGGQQHPGDQRQRGVLRTGHPAAAGFIVLRLGQEPARSRGGRPVLAEQG